MFAFVQASAMEHDFVYRYRLQKLKAKWKTCYRNALEQCGEAQDVNWLEWLPEEEAVWREIAHPVFVFWLEHRLVPALHSGERERMRDALGQVGRFFFVPLQKRGVAVPTWKIALDDRGELQFPGHGYRLSFGERARRQEATLVRRGDALDVHVDGQQHVIRWAEFVGAEAVTSDLLHRQHFLGNETVELHASDPLVREFLEVDFREILTQFQQTDCAGLPAYERPTLADHWYYDKAFAIIRQHWPAMYEEMCGHIRLIGLVDTKRIGGGTTPSFQGAIFLSHRPEDLHWTIENIIHECAHARLYQLCALDALLLNAKSEKYRSPWRADLRPMEGIFQGMFVFTRVAIWYQRLLEHQEAPEVRERLGVVLQEIGQAAEVLEAHGVFTELGSALFAEMQQVWREISEKCSVFVS